MPTRTETRESLEAIKIVALAHGIRVDPDVLEGLGGPAALTVHEYATTGGITLELPENVLVNAPFDGPFAERSALRLLASGDGLALELDGVTTPVRRVVPLPGYLQARDAAGRPATDVAMSHGDRIRISPIFGCAYDCRFCDLAHTGYGHRPIEQLLQAIDIARDDAALPPRHLLISGGSAPIKHAPGQDYFEDVCLAVAGHLRDVRNADGSRFEVDIMMSARPDGPAFVERVVAAGVTGFSFNVEVFSDEHARRHLPLKHKWSRVHLEAMITRAVELLGWGNARVRSLIIPGLESLEDTVAGVDWLASLGASPVLSPFRPAPDTDLAEADPVEPELLGAILDESREIVRRHGVALGPRCVPCQHNTLSLPWDFDPLEHP